MQLSSSPDICFDTPEMDLSADGAPALAEQMKIIKELANQVITRPRSNAMSFPERESF